MLLYIHIHTYTYIYIHILQYTYIYIHILTRAWRKLTDDAVTIMICKLEHMYGDTCAIPRSMHDSKDACSLFYINTWAMIWPVDYQAIAS